MEQHLKKKRLPTLLLLATKSPKLSKKLKFLTDLSTFFY